MKMPAELERSASICRLSWSVTLAGFLPPHLPSPRMGVSAGPETVSRPFSPQRIWLWSSSRGDQTPSSPSPPADWSLADCSERGRPPEMIAPFFLFFTPSAELSEAGISCIISHRMSVFSLYCVVPACTRVCLNRTSACASNEVSPALSGEGARSACSAVWFLFSLAAKASRTFPLSCGAGPYRPISRASRRFLQYRRAGLAREWTSFFCPHWLAAKKARRYLALWFLCSLCLAPPMEDTHTHTQKKGPGGKRDTARPHVSHRHLEAELPGMMMVDKKKRIHPEEISYVHVPVLMTASPPPPPFLLPYTRLHLW